MSCDIPNTCPIINDGQESLRNAIESIEEAVKLIENLDGELLVGDDTYSSILNELNNAVSYIEPVMGDTLEEVRDANSGLRSYGEKMDGEASDLDTEISNLQSDITTLENEVENVKSDLGCDIDRLESDVNDSQGESDNLRGTVSELESRVEPALYMLGMNYALFIDRCESKDINNRVMFFIYLIPYAALVGTLAGTFAEFLVFAPKKLIKQ